MRLNAQQTRTAKAILNVFETSFVRGVYDEVTTLDGDTGGLTYGRSQTTIRSGNLTKMLTRYMGNADAYFSVYLDAYNSAIKNARDDLATDEYFKNILRACADDPVMRAEQDKFFDDAFWKPALKEARNLGAETALGMAIIYDGFIHGSWPRLRNMTNEMVGRLVARGEEDWFKTYVILRRGWLAEHSNPLLHRTVYRMDEFQALIDSHRWDLQLPIYVRNKDIDEETLNGPLFRVYEGPEPGDRVIKLGPTMVRGADVRLIQLHLSDPEIGRRYIVADGIFGPNTGAHVAAFKRSVGLEDDDVVDDTVLVELGILG